MQAHLQGIAVRDAPYPVIDTQLYRVHQRVAASFRVQRAVLVGDAAHINSPVGGVGLNSGVHDAFDVTRRLARVLHEQADLEAELDAFATARRAVAVEHVQADTARNTRRLREKAAEARVPTVQDIPLARALYGSTEIGQEIPPQLFTAVARVLAFVMQLSARGVRGGVHRPGFTPPDLADLPVAGRRRGVPPTP